MAKSELKTRKNARSVPAFLKAVKDPQQRADSLALIELLQEITGEPPAMWGTSIVGFGSYHYVSTSGREGDWMLTGFSPRQQNLTIYVMCGFEPFAAELQRLGKHKTSMSCLSFKRLADLHLPTLRKIVKRSVALTRKQDRA